MSKGRAGRRRRATAKASTARARCVAGRILGGGQPAPRPGQPASSRRPTRCADFARRSIRRPGRCPTSRARAMVARRRQIVEDDRRGNRRTRLASRRALKSVDRLLKALQRNCPRGRDRASAGCQAETFPGVGETLGTRQEDRRPRVRFWGGRLSRPPCATRRSGRRDRSQTPWQTLEKQDSRSPTPVRSVSRRVRGASHCR